MRTASGSTSSRTRPRSASTGRIDVPLVGDLRGVVPQLVEALRDTPARAVAEPRDPGSRPTPPSWRESPTSAPSGRTPVHPARFVVEATKAFARQGRHHGARRRRDRHLPVDLLAVQAARRDLEPELRSSRHGSAVRDRCVGRRGRQAPGHAADQRLGVPVPHRRTGDRGAAESAAGLRRRRRPPVGPRGRRLQAHVRPGRRRRPACTGARTCASTRSPRASAATASTSRRRTRSARRSSARTPAARSPSCTCCIDPKANSEEMPKYDEIPNLVRRRHAVGPTGIERDHA